MMKTIWKFDLRVTDYQEVLIPEGAEILCVRVQAWQPKMWALCDTDKPVEVRKLRLYGTGNQIPENPGKYIGTFEWEGYYIWHLFEVEGGIGG